MRTIKPLAAIVMEVAFFIFINFLPLPDLWRLCVLSLSAFIVVLSLGIYLSDQYGLIEAFNRAERLRRIMTLAIIALIGATIALASWLWTAKILNASKGNKQEGQTPNNAPIQDENKSNTTGHTGEGAYLRATQFAAALGDPARDIVIELTLKDGVRFSDISPLNAGFQFLGQDAEGNFRGVIMSLSDHSAGRQVFMMSNASFYWINWAYMDDPKNKVHTYGLSAPTGNIKVIRIPFRYQSTEGQPFTTLRSFNGSFFKPFLSQLLLEKVTKIQLLVNGWVILDADPTLVFWRANDVTWPVFDAPTHLFDAWSSDFKGAHPPTGRWLLRFLENVPDYKPTIPGPYR